MRLDTTLMRRTYYNYNDHRLIGHKLTLSRKSVKGNFPEKAVCLDPNIKVQQISMDSLIEETMGTAEEENDTKAVDRYKIPVDGEKPLPVIWIGCKEGDVGPDTPAGPEGFNWVAVLSDNQIAMRWYDNTILLLKRLIQ